MGKLVKKWTKKLSILYEWPHRKKNFLKGFKFPFEFLGKTGDFWTWKYQNLESKHWNCHSPSILTLRNDWILSLLILTFRVFKQIFPLPYSFGTFSFWTAYLNTKKGEVIVPDGYYETEQGLLKSINETISNTNSTLSNVKYSCGDSCHYDWN